MNEWRRECRRRGLRWRDVIETARGLRCVELERREAFDGARRVAWQAYCHFAGRSPGCHPFWRVGFEHVLGRLANSGRDYTAIRAYDLIAVSVGEQFPQWIDRCEDLWEFLATPYQPLPPLTSYIEEALELLTPQMSEVPF